MEIKENDVYRFRFNDEYVKNHFEPYWCFDGQLIVRTRSDGSFYLQDTYYSDGKTMTLETALKNGTLTFVCNLNDVEPIEKYQRDYYDDDDLFDLSHQKHCYDAYYKRKGAQRSLNKMRKSLQNKIDDYKYQIESANRNLESCYEDMEKLNNGDTTFYIS